MLPGPPLLYLIREKASPRALKRAGGRFAKHTTWKPSTVQRRTVLGNQYMGLMRLRYSHGTVVGTNHSVYSIGLSQSSYSLTAWHISRNQTCGFVNPTITRTKGEKAKKSKARKRDKKGIQKAHSEAKSQ